MTPRKPTLSTRTWLAPEEPATDLESSRETVVRTGDLLQIGAVLNNEFVLEKLLGQGGFGKAFLAQQLKLGTDQPWRTVVLKVSRHSVHDARHSSRFEQEAAVLSKLKSPHIVNVFSFGETRDRRLFFAMEYGGDETVRHLLEREGRLGWRRALAMGAQICEALEEAARKHVIHRDLKPDNILLSQQEGHDWIKVVDFGVARMTEELGQSPAGPEARTETGLFVGTPQYASPEQAQVGAIDGRSDLYALGIILFEMIAGKRPLPDKRGQEMLIEHLNTPPATFASLGVDAPPAVEQLIRRALEKSPLDRFQSATEMRQAILGLLDSRETSAADADRPLSTRQVRIRWAAAALALGLIAGLTLMAVRRAPSAPRTALAPMRLLLQSPTATIRVPGIASPPEGEATSVPLSTDGTLRVEDAAGGWGLDLRYHRDGPVLHVSFTNTPEITPLTDGLAIAPEQAVDVSESPRRIVLRLKDGQEVAVLVRATVP